MLGALSLLGACSDDGEGGADQGVAGDQAIVFPDGGPPLWGGCDVVVTQLLKQSGAARLCEQAAAGGGPGWEALVARERRASWRHGGRTVFGPAAPPAAAPKRDDAQLALPGLDAPAERQRAQGAPRPAAAAGSAS